MVSFLCVLQPIGVIRRNTEVVTIEETQNTFTSLSISNETLITGTTVGTVVVGTNSVFAAYTRFLRTLVYVWCNT